MVFMKSKLCAATVLILLLLSFTSCKANSNGTAENNTGAASQASLAVYYKDFDIMSEASDAIIIGKVTQIAYQKENTLTTDYVFVISQNFKGGAEDVILLHHDGLLPALKVGEQYVLFLRLAPTGKFYIVGADQGRYKLVNDKVYSMDYTEPNWLNRDQEIPPVPPELQINGISKQDFIKITLETLRQTPLPAS